MASLLIHGLIIRFPGLHYLSAPPKSPDALVDRAANLIEPETRQWRWDLIHTMWQLSYALAICSVLLTQEGQAYSLVWGPHSMGAYTVKSAYKWMLLYIDPRLTQTHPIFRDLYGKRRYHAKLKFFFRANGFGIFAFCEFNG